ncbi:MAG: lasso peptide biosynthesis B2 protein, partial [Candidatus Fermentibacteria bacterium]
EKAGEIRSPLTLDRVVYLCERVLRIFQRHRYKYSCLKRSLLLYHFLRYYQVSVVINFGVKWMDAGLTGHSWLTLDEAPYLEPPGKPDLFTHFFSLPGDPDDLPDREEPQAADSPSLEDVSFD